MKKLKVLGWSASFLLACALVGVASSHVELQAIAGAHRDFRFYLVLAFLLAIPAKVVMLVAGYLIELLLVGWSESSLRLLLQPRASVRLDVLSIIVMLMVPLRHLGWLMTFGLLYLLESYAAHQPNYSLTHLISTWGPQMAAFLLLQSFVHYWKHRAEHAIPALWALHKFHHSADCMSMLTSARQTQLTKAFEVALVIVPLGLLTSPATPTPGVGSPLYVAVVVYLAYNAFLQVNGYLVHSNMTTDYGWIGRWLFVSPRMHRLHHATAPEYHDKNFTFDLVIWDRLFGTYAHCETAAEALALPLGLDENPFNNQNTVAGVLRDYFLTTYVEFWHELRRGFKAWLPTRSTAQQYPVGLPP
jgi:sterol desaturase/sphingolipid hydroxylase (fatty acid hydroxylase superfamily)